MPAQDLITPDPFLDVQPYQPTPEPTPQPQESGWDKFLNFLRTYFGFGSGGPAAGNSQGATHIGTGVVGVGSQEPLSPENGQAIIDYITGDNTAKADSSSGSAQTVGSISLDDLFGSSAKSVDPVLQSYYNIYQKTGNEAYLEKLLEYNASLHSIASAREWEKMMSDTSFSRLVADISKAGYNPWLALQGGVSGGSAYSTQSAGAPGGSATSQAVSERNNERNVAAEITGSIIRGMLLIALFALRKH